MNSSCEIIGDLLPLYLDEVCSPASKALVEEHLCQCSGCSTLLQSLKKEEQQEKLIQSQTARIVKRHRQKEFSGAIKAVSKRFLILVLVCLGVLLLFGATSLYATMTQIVLSDNRAYTAHFDEEWIIGKSVEEIEARYGKFPLWQNENGTFKGYLVLGGDNLYCYIYFENHIAVKTDIGGRYGG